MPYNPNIHHRRSIRLPGYDYASAGAYFVTICTHERRRFFGQVQEGDMHVSAAGQIVRDCWNDLPRHYAYVSVDTFVVMPDHVHGIVLLRDRRDAAIPTSSQRHGLPEIVRALKSFSARHINETQATPGVPVWQRNYYEHIVRNQPALERIRAYILANPARWRDDT